MSGSVSAFQFRSTRNPDSKHVDFKQAVLEGLAPDGGLFYPVEIPRFPSWQWAELRGMPIAQLANEYLQPFVADSIENSQLESICQRVFSFPFDLIEVKAGVWALELFHGPTLAFKDVGARFLAECLARFAGDRPSVVLVATSGDTGSAVANGFLGVEGVETVILYPKGKVSPLQEKQFASLGRNVQALAVQGSFDDCQYMVKQAFTDKVLRQAVPISSANSINVARWLPQGVYYLATAVQFDEPCVFSVPSGNYGNITAGLMAERCGMPAAGWVATSNANDIVPRYLMGHDYYPQASVSTLANAMDVGAPSNFERLQALFGQDHTRLRQHLKGASFQDREIEECIKKVQSDCSYLLDPHGATGWLGLEEHNHNWSKETPRVFLETAHPAKFQDAIKAATGIEAVLPDRLQAFESREVNSLPINSDFAEFRSYLMDRFA